MSLLQEGGEGRGGGWGGVGGEVSSLYCRSICVLHQEKGYMCDHNEKYSRQKDKEKNRKKTNRC